MDKAEKKCSNCGAAFTILIVIICAFGLKFVYYERNPNGKIYDLQQQVLMLNEKIDNKPKVTWRGV